MCHTKGEVCLVNGIHTDTHTHTADTATRVSVGIREKEARLRVSSCFYIMHLNEDSGLNYIYLAKEKV